MRINDTIYDRDLLALFDRVSDLIGKPRINRRGLVLEQRAADLVWRPLTIERNGLELEHHRLLRKARLRGGRTNINMQDPVHSRLLSFLTMLDRTLPQLSEPAAKALLQKAKSCLDSDDGYAPLAYELRTALHLMRSGDVEFYDYERGGGFDFLVTRNATAFEVECKYVTTDKGRAIFQLPLVHLAENVRPRLKAIGANDHGPMHLTIGLGTRLTTNLPSLDAIAAGVEQAWLQRPHEYVISDVARVRFSPMPDAPHDKIWDAALSGDHDTVDDLAARLGADPRAHHVLSGGRTSYILMSVSGHQADKVVDKIIRDLKGDADRQFTGDRAAIMFVQMSGLSGEQLVALRNSPDGSKLNEVADTLFDRRPHVHTLIFTADLDVARTFQVDGWATSDRTTALSFKNNRHPERDNPDIQFWTDEDQKIA